MERPAELEEVVGQKRLADRVTGILARIEEELDHVDSRIGEAMHVLDADNDGLVRPLPAALPNICHAVYSSERWRDGVPAM